MEASFESWLWAISSLGVVASEPTNKGESRMDVASDFPRRQNNSSAKDSLYIMKINDINLPTP